MKFADRKPSGRKVLAKHPKTEPQHDRSQLSELRLKRREVAIKVAEHRRSRWANPLLVGIFAATIAALTSIAGVWWNAYRASELERAKWVRLVRDARLQKIEARVSTLAELLVKSVRDYRITLTDISHGRERRDKALSRITSTGLAFRTESQLQLALLSIHSPEMASDLVAVVDGVRAAGTSAYNRVYNLGKNHPYRFGDPELKALAREMRELDDLTDTIGTTLTTVLRTRVGPPSQTTTGSNDEATLAEPIKDTIGPAANGPLHASLR